MKKSMIAMLITLLLVAPSGAQIFTDNFEYPEGDTLSNHWITLAPLGDIDYMRITNFGLTFDHYAGSGIGRAVRLDTTGPDGAAQFFSFGGITDGSIYISFMVSVFSARSEGDYFTGILPFSIAGSPYGKVFAKDSAGFIAFGVSKTSGIPVYSRAQYQRNETYLIVLKYAFEPGMNNDRVSLFIFDSPPPYTEPVPNAGPAGTGESDIPGAFAFALYQCYESRLLGAIFDGLYVDTYWNNNVLPVELANFSANVVQNNVILNWSTYSELNNAGFAVERRPLESANWLTAGNLAGSSTTNSLSSYSFIDRSLSPGIYNYRLKQTDFTGNFEYFVLNEAVTIGVPYKFFLAQNYPNPFNPQTVIGFLIGRREHVELKVYDALGRRVATLLDEIREAGIHYVTFDASPLPAGVYFYRLNAGEFTNVKKMTVAK